MKQRPILVAVIGYVIGILGGLYFSVGMVLCYILLLAIYFKKSRKRKFKLLSIHRYSRYLKLIFDKKVVFILSIFSLISCGVVLYQNQQYENAYQEGEELQIVGIVVSQKIEKQYYDLYQIKLLGSKPFHLYIQVNKKSKELAYGDKVQVQGTYKKPAKQRNYGGYDDEQYLKTLKIVGRMKVKQIKILANNQLNPIKQLANTVNVKMKERIEKNLDENKAGIVKGLLLGDTTQIDEEVKEKFQISNISHILAISGMHVAYIALGIQALGKRCLGKKKAKIITIIILIFYVFITGFSPSIVRAVTMAVLSISAGLLYRKNDTWNAIAISLFGILLYNPFLILNVGLQLSYLGTIGIILFHSNFLHILNFIKKQKIKEILAVTLSAQVAIFPILWYHFNIIGIYFLITNLLVSIMIGPLILIGFFSLFVSWLAIFLKIGVEILYTVASFSQLPFSKIYVATPSIVSIIFYFIAAVIFKQIYFIYHFNHLTATQKRIKNLIALFQYRFRSQKRRYKRWIAIFFIVVVMFNFLPQNLKIYFVDVGQGDCTFIETPQRKTILIDGGGSLTDEFDVGKNILLPYLLDRGYTSIDYMMISHFDQDHVGGLLTILEELKVKNIIITKQGENSKQYQDFIRKVEQKNGKIRIVGQGDRVQIENEVYFDILWPQKQLVNENVLNNNSMVANMHYYGFSMLFTGDIEKVAEKKILEENKEMLMSTVLKVAHHGSKSSSIEELLKGIKPKIALIGVGEKNTFGHPNDEVIKRIEGMRC